MVLRDSIYSLQNHYKTYSCKEKDRKDRLKKKERKILQQQNKHSSPDIETNRVRAQSCFGIQRRWW